MFSSKQTHMLDYFICYHLESGWHVTRPKRRGKSLGMRLNCTNTGAENFILIALKLQFLGQKNLGEGTI